jgi:hypothetical protein
MIFPAVGRLIFASYPERCSRPVRILLIHRGPVLSLGSGVVSPEGRRPTRSHHAAPVGEAQHLGDGVTGLAVSANLACLLGIEGEFTVLDVRDAAAPRKLGSLRFESELGPAWSRVFTGWGRRCGIVIDGRYAYVATGASGVQVIDIADPAHPREFFRLKAP